jgi:hypothetical protein
MMTYTASANLERWKRHPPAAFTLVENRLVWDTAEGCGVVTKYGVGDLPPAHIAALRR